MVEGEPSKTALHVAAARAAHLRFDPPPHILEDPCAEALLGDELEALLPQYADDGLWLLVENRLFIPLRARYAEDRLAEAYMRGVRQLVVLGAGLDSYAFRRPEEQAELRVFEVDHAGTQRWKLDRLEALGWAIPEHLTFVPCDFERTSVSGPLRAAGFSSGDPAVVNWMGVVYYLTPETALQTLVDLRSLLAPGSEVVLDYQFPVAGLSSRYQEIQAGMTSYLEDAGEPQLNRYRPEELRKTIERAGFSGAVLETREVLYRRYFKPLRTKIPMSERFGLAVAYNGSR
jgi:methyltransferase (TIGR00027 family)